MGRGGCRAGHGSRGRRREDAAEKTCLGRGQGSRARTLKRPVFKILPNSSPPAARRAAEHRPMRRCSLASVEGREQIWRLPRLPAVREVRGQCSSRHLSCAAARCVERHAPAAYSMTIRRCVGVSRSWESGNNGRHKSESQESHVANCQEKPARNDAKAILKSKRGRSPRGKARCVDA